MFSHIPQDEIFKLCDLRLQSEQDEQVYLFRVVEILDALFDADSIRWVNLSEETKKWFNSAVDAIADKKPIESFLFTLDKDIESLKCKDDFKSYETVYDIPLPASKCKQGQFYVVKDEGDIKIVECIQVTDDFICLEHASSKKRIFLEPEMRVLKLGKVPQLKKIVKSSTKVPIDKLITIIVCDNPSITPEEVVELLQGDEKLISQINKIKKRTLEILEILKDLGRLKDATPS